MHTSDLFPESFLARLTALERTIEPAVETKLSPNQRAYYCDSGCVIRTAFTQALVGVMPRFMGAMSEMRFLRYVVTFV